MLIAKRLPKCFKSKKNLRTLEVDNRGIFENSQLQIDLPSSYKKECTILQILFSLPQKKIGEFNFHSRETNIHKVAATKGRISKVVLKLPNV